jgi:hypothetical protein
MYPARELTRLADRKAAVRRDIAVRRARCAEAAARVAQPLALLDGVLAFCRRPSPLAQFAVVALGLFARRNRPPRRGIAGSLLRWSPLVFGAARVIRSVVMTRFGATHSCHERGRRRGPEPVEDGWAGAGAPPGENGSRR